MRVGSSLLIGALLLTMPISHAARGDVPRAYLTVATRHQLPPVVLYSIALCESGRIIASGHFRPWPWTLNIDGEGRYFEDRQQAIEVAHAAINIGSTVDVGIMQVNWHWHGHRFDSVADAFDPYVNLNVGATILKQLSTEHGGLWQGIGHYHSTTPERADAYQSRCVRLLVDTLDQQVSGL